MKKFRILLLTLFLIFTAFTLVYAESAATSSLEIQNGVIGEMYPCGSDMVLELLYQPIMTKSQSYMKAEGMFILFRVRIVNGSAKTIKGLKNNSFTLSKIIDGKEIDFPLAGGYSRDTSKAWEINVLSDELIPHWLMDTFLVFDVEGNYDDPWVLTFSPIERGTDKPRCTIRLKLPEISLK